LLIGQWKFGLDAMSWGLSGLFAFLVVQYVANVQVPSKKGGYWKKLLKFILLFPLFLALSMGLSLHNTVAVIQGWLGKQSAFVRTPKFNIQGWKDSIKSRHYLSSKITWTTFFEGVLTIYFLAAIYYGFQKESLHFLALHILLALGYGTTFFYTLKHLKFK
jgi:hypothetical protein